MIKTIAKNGIVTIDSGVVVSKESGQTILGLPSMESSKVLLAFLKANQRHVCESGTAFQAVAIGNGMMLVGHPHAGFMYADATNIALLPRLILKNYQEDTTIALERTIGSGDFVLHFGAQQGYHLLTIAELVGPSGVVVAFELSKDFNTLKLNVGAHMLESRISVISHEIRSCQSLTLLTPPGKNCVVFVSEGTQLDPATASSLASFLKINSLALVIDGARVVSSEDYVAKLYKTTITPFASAA